MEKLITSIFLTTTAITIIPNIIFVYNYFIKKKYDNIWEANLLYLWSLYLFFVFGFIKLNYVVYNWLY